MIKLPVFIVNSLWAALYFFLRRGEYWTDVVQFCVGYTGDREYKALRKVFPLLNPNSERFNVHTKKISVARNKN